MSYELKRIPEEDENFVSEPNDSSDIASFPNASAAKEYLQTIVDNLDISDEEKLRLEEAIKVLAGKQGEVVTRISTAGKLQMFFGQSHNYKPVYISVTGKVCLLREDVDSHLFGDYYNGGDDKFAVGNLVGNEPQFIGETVSRKVEAEQKHFFGLIKRKVTKTENQFVKRVVLPEEQEDLYEQVCSLYIDKPKTQKLLNTHIFDKVNRNSYWIMTVENKEMVEEAQKLAAELAESFPEITIEILLDFKRKSKKV